MTGEFKTKTNNYYANLSSNPRKIECRNKNEFKSDVNLNGQKLFKEQTNMVNNKKVRFVNVTK